MIKRLYEPVEITPFYYEPLDSLSVKAFLEQQQGRISLNLHVHQDSAVAYVGLQKPGKQRFFRNTSFPFVYPYVEGIPTSCFTAEARKGVCFPFQMDSTWNVVELLGQRLQSYPCNLYLQLLLQKQNDQWKEKAKGLYQDYLNGIANPSPLSWVNQIQQQCNYWMQEWFGEYTNEPIPNFNQKVSEPGFLWCLRIAIQTHQTSLIQKALVQIRNVLSVLSAENNFYLKKTNQSPKRFIRGMQLHEFPIGLYRHPILSVSELVPFFKEKDSNEQPETSTSSHSSDQRVESQEETFSSHPFPPAFDLLPSRSMRKDEASYELFKRLVLALYKIGIRPHQPFELVNMQSGPSLDKVTLKIPTGVTFRDMEREQKNLEAELGTSGIQIGRGAIPGTISVSVMKQERSVVWLKDILSHPHFEPCVREMKIPLLMGINETGELFMDCLDRLKHLLVCGTTGSGKSYFLNGFIVPLMMLRSPREIRFYLIDPKRVEFNLYRKSFHTETVETDPTKAIHLLQALVKEMERRYDLFSDLGVRHIDSYNEKAASPLPRLIVVIDEFADLILLDPSVEEPVVRLGQLARASGIHVILATQRPSVNVVTGLIKANLPSRIVFACSSQHDYKTALDVKPPKLLGKGDGVAQLEGIQELIRFQGAVVTFHEEEMERIIESLNEHWGQSRTWELPVIDEGTEEKDLQRMKQLITETGECSSTFFQKQLRIRRQKVSDLMKQLVKEGWLQEPDGNGRGYRILLSQEEMELRLKDQKNIPFPS